MEYFQFENKKEAFNSLLKESGIEPRISAKYLESFQDEENMLMFKMYTAMVNPTVDSSFLRSEYRKNKDSFMCEFGAEFSDTVTSWIDIDTINSTIIDPSKTTNEKCGVYGKEYYMGIDYGGKTDGTSVAIVHKDEDKIILDYAEVFYSGSSDIWDNKGSIYKDCSKEFSGFEIIPIGQFSDKIKELCEKFFIVDGWFDQFNGYGLLECLKDRGLYQFRMQPVSASLNTQIFQLTKMLISGGLIRLFNHNILRITWFMNYTKKSP